MIRKTIIALAVIIAAFHVAWYAKSISYQDSGLPDIKASDEYMKDFMKRQNITVDLAGLEETDIEADGFRLHLVILPAKQKAPTLVFIPGTSVYAKFYIEFMGLMRREGFNVVGFDPRGHGMSSGPRGDYTINEEVDNTLAVVAYAKKRFGGKIAISGSSQGGMVAFYTAAKDDTIAAAVCHNIADLNGRDNLVLSQLRPPQLLAPLAGFMMGLYAKYSIPISMYLDLEKELMKNGVDAVTFSVNDPQMVRMITFRAMNSLLRTDLARPVEKITVPVMLIHSDQDNIFPREYVESIYNRLTCKKNYLLFKNTDHLVMTNKPAEVAPEAAKWLRSVIR